MDWSLIMLLFASGFALAGLGFLMKTVHNVRTKPPPSQNIPPSTVSPPYAAPQPPALPSYNWSLNSGRVQKLALGQGSGMRSELPPGQGRIPVGGAEEGESGLIPIVCSNVSARIPVFQPEPVYWAERVYEDAAPSPNSVAIPIENAPLEPGGVATPAEYFREQPVIQDVPARKMKHFINRADHCSSVADPISEDGEVQNLFGQPQSNIVDAVEVHILDDDSESIQTKSFVQEPPIPISKISQEPELEQEAALECGSELESEPEVESEFVPQHTPAAESENPSDSESAMKDTPQKTKSQGKNGKTRKKKAKEKSKNDPPIPTAPPAERILSEEEDEGTTQKRIPHEEVSQDKKPGLNDRGGRFLRETFRRIKENVPEFAQKNARHILFCVCIVVCLLCVVHFANFGKGSDLDDLPVVVDIPQGTPDIENQEASNEPEDTDVLEATLPSYEKEPEYIMSMIGEQEAVSPTPDGFEPDFEAIDYTDVPFYSLSFAIRLDSSPGEEFQKIQVFDANTMEDLTATTSTGLHVYAGEIPTDEYFSSHPVKSAPVVSSAVSDEIITCVFVSLDKYSISDLKVMLYQANSVSDEPIENEVVVNGQPEDLGLNTTYPMGNSLMKLGDQYYVAESGTGIGSVPDENKYVTRKIRCVSLPLTGAVSGLDTSSIGLFDRQTGTDKELPAGTELYYKENYVENEALMEIAFGIQLAGGSYEEAAEFLDESIPGYIIDGHTIMI